MKKQEITNGLLYRDGGTFAPGSLYICGERIVSKDAYDASAGDAVTVDASGCYVIPGLVDIHTHGCAGSDCCDGTADALRAIARYALRQGVTAITPATMTLPPKRLEQICQTTADFCSWGGAALCDSGGTGFCDSDSTGFCDPDGADICGLYLEGPFLSPAKKGAQDAAHIHRPDADLFRRLQDCAKGMIRTVAIAPETEGAMDFIRAFSGEVRVSLAHTAADYETAREALLCGASQLTHMYNAMPPFSHRAPGPIGAAADDPHCMAELICDGLHVHPAVVRASLRMFGPDRILFVSDSMRATGLSDGTYDLGGQEVTVRGNRATLRDGTIAGSVTNLMDCVRTAALKMGIPLATAVQCASENSARALGIAADHGSLTAGHLANVVLLSAQTLDAHTILHRGNRVEL